MSRLISFVLADSSCEAREESENCKMIFLQSGLNPLPIAYQTGTVCRI